MSTVKFPIFVLIMLNLVCCTNNQPKPTASKLVLEQLQQGFDSLAAERYGADDYGMKPYVMAFLKRGPNRSLDSTQAAQLQSAHLNNIGRMAEAGKLVVAGPFLDNGDLRGIYIFNVATVEEAEELTNSDPAIQAGSLVMELKPWYGSAGLMAVNEIHERIARKGI